MIILLFGSDSAGQVRKKCFLRNCKPANVLMTGENFLTAFSKGRFGLANNVCKIFCHFVTIVAYERKHALNQI
jgi:hypothetical protein